MAPVAIVLTTTSIDIDEELMNRCLVLTVDESREQTERIHALQDQLTSLRVFVEAAIDFPDEEIDFLAESDTLQRLETCGRDLESLLSEARQGRLLRDGIVLAIVGRPNAGKSSLLNAFSGQESAIVTEIPGTTRDVLREQIDIGGVPVHVADTAGIRETQDRIEAEGVRRARQALEEADIVLLVEDLSDEADSCAGLHEELPSNQARIQVGNKVDLLDEKSRARLESDSSRVCISARTGQGLEDLRKAILDLAGAHDLSEGSFSARQRHVDALRRSRKHITRGHQALAEMAAGEILAEELRLAQQALGEITGEMLPDDLLGAIFASFCIGK
jgi:tRNA modification GTPase